MDETKVCVTCHEVRPLSAFNRRVAATDGLQSRCRECYREWYLKNKATHQRNTRRRNDEIIKALRERVREYLLAHPCVDCGETDIRCLEFDHIDPATKTSSVSQLIRDSMSWQKVLQEIEKCLVRCSNCHSRRTAKMLNSWRHQVWLQSLPSSREEIVL